ncbi:hypothetical protein HHI36_014841 [Cryptolaemus montrouzieri]|uniref:Uncharacterized protein n=1 Tax=Cryptolaemus montrouzieri TaxID=559131 RepID=A0ABD2N4S8_9CUCU
MIYLLPSDYGYQPPQTEIYLENRKMCNLKTTTNGNEAVNKEYVDTQDFLEKKPADLLKRYDKLEVAIVRVMKNFNLISEKYVIFKRDMELRFKNLNDKVSIASGLLRTTDHIVKSTQDRVNLIEKDVETAFRNSDGKINGIIKKISDLQISMQNLKRLHGTIITATPRTVATTQRQIYEYNEL